MHEKSPYCIITKLIGKIINPDVVPIIHAINQDDYPKEALEQAKQLAQEFD